jgi:RHS repeat-associated protein
LAVANGEWNVDSDILPIEINGAPSLTFVIYDLDGAVPVECVDCTVTPISTNLDTSVRGFYQATFNATNGTTIDYDFNVRFFVGATEVSSETVVETVSYTYDVTWIDLLRSYDIQIGNDEYTTTFTYEGNDTQGTPSVITKYLNSVVVEVIDLRWSGRSLMEYTVHGDLARTIDLYSLSFTYNDQGYRTSKTYVSSIENYTIEYTLLGSQVIYETDGSYGIYFSYDTYGNIISFNYDDDVATVGDGDEYFYLRNLQGDIYAILDSTGQVVIRYVYDAYGNILDETFVATGYQYLFDANPYTYRGYRFDRETGLFYLQSRYFDSFMGRFISVDEPGLVVLGENIFSYCTNNPITNVDPSGYLSFGRNNWNSVKTIGLAIELLIIVIPLISGFFKALKLVHLMGAIGRKAIAKIADAALVLLVKTLFLNATRSIVQTLVVGITLVIFNAIGDGIGVSIAKVFDKLDGNPDGYIFA